MLSQQLIIARAWDIAIYAVVATNLFDVGRNEGLILKVIYDQHWNEDLPYISDWK